MSIDQAKDKLKSLVEYHKGEWKFYKLQAEKFTVPSVIQLTQERAEIHDQARRRVEEILKELDAESQEPL